jgi:hypothetical protein
MSRMRPGTGSVLVPALSSIEWEAGVALRMVLFRDWVPATMTANWKERGIDLEKLRRLRFVAVERMSGMIVPDLDNMFNNIVPFTIVRGGLIEIDLEDEDVTIPAKIVSPVKRPPKRPFAEIADSEGEEDDENSEELYGWIGDDDLAAEGLLIDEGPLVSAVARHSDT